MAAPTDDARGRDGDGDGEKLERSKSRLGALTELALPTDYPRPLPLQVVAAQQTAALDDALCLTILQNAIKAKATPFTLVLAAFGIWVARCTGEEDVVLARTHDGQPLILRLQITGDTTLADLCVQISDKEHEAIADAVPIERLLTTLARDDPGRNLAALTRLRVVHCTEALPAAMTDQSSSSDVSSDVSLIVTQVPTAHRLMPVDLTVIYNTVLFTGARIDEMLAQLTLIRFDDFWRATGDADLTHLTQHGFNPF